MGVVVVSEMFLEWRDYLLFARYEAGNSHHIIFHISTKYMI
jgi:hypothetical protein